MRAPHPPSLSELVRAIREPVVATIAATSAFACLLLVAGGGGRLPEMLVLGAVVIGAYTLPAAAPRYLALLAGAAYLTVELAEGRVSYDHYWTHVVAGVLLGVAVMAAAAARRDRSSRIAETDRATALVEALRHEDELERLLAGERRLGPLERELLRSKRHDRSAGMLLIRPDGVEAADPLRAQELLRQVATHVGRGLRTSDVAFRQGRFDVCILLPETEPAGARAAGERLRLALLQESAPSVSIGAATFPSAASHELLLSRAEEALERARQLGGNRTVASALALDAPPAWQLPEPHALTRTRD